MPLFYPSVVQVGAMAGITKPIYCAHWSCLWVLKYVPCAVDRSWKQMSMGAPNVIALKNIRVGPVWMHWCCRIFSLFISVPKFWECAQCEWANAGAFFGWWFLHPHFESVPNVNALVLAHFSAFYCSTQILRVHPMWMCSWWRIFWVVTSVPKFWECTQYKYASVGAFFRWMCPRWMC